MAFLWDVKSSVATVDSLLLTYFSKLNAFLASIGEPQIFSAKTFKAASVGSPIRLKLLPSTSIRALLLYVHPVASEVKSPP